MTEVQKLRCDEAYYEGQALALARIFVKRPAEMDIGDLKDNMRAILAELDRVRHEIFRAGRGAT